MYSTSLTYMQLEVLKLRRHVGLIKESQQIKVSYDAKNLQFPHVKKKQPKTSGNSKG